MSEGFFDRLAPGYRQYARLRRRYLDAVDRLVLQGLTGTSLLDVGSGDGERALAIAGRAGLSRVVLCEPSAAMRGLCRIGAGPAGARVDLLDLRAEDLDRLGERFDNVICLWNVLGHVPARADRVRALRNMGALLAPGGRLQLDVNNRYNVRAYGLGTVLWNRVRDWRHPAGADGERPLAIQVDGRLVKGQGYVFAPSEMERMLAEAGLRVLARAPVDYRTGDVRRTRLEGQLFYQLARAGGQPDPPHLTSITASTG